MPSPTTDLPRPRKGSLTEVRAVIPEACYERPTGRAVVAVAQGALLWLAPVVLLVLTGAAWWSIGLSLLAGLGVAGLFVLGHDASHSALFGSAAANRWVARLCMVPSIHNEAAWDLGHNRIHHGFTTRLGFDFVWQPLSVEQYQALGRLARLRHRLEWSWLGAGAYYTREVWWNKMIRFRPEGKRAAPYRRNNRFLAASLVGLTAVLVAVGWWQGGPLRAGWLVLMALVIPFLVFSHVIGWTVYVHHIAPDIRWWPAREWTQFRGQMESTTILEFPAVVDVLWFHHIFVHTPHHVDPRIPFHRLPRAAAAIEQAFPDVVRRQRWSLRRYLRDTKACKLYDADAAHWVAYPA
ncbi:MAG: fatty acid desaturase [Acidimicrobiales bacterium]|nr:fatty acid desaturase [Acidimicrobiales bacterium]